jgi:hypothetical protein
MPADGGRRALNVLLIVGLSALALFGAALLVWLWALSNSNGSPPPAESAMLAMPESSLAYPNATHVQKLGQGTECRDGDWQPALIEFTFATSDPTNDVFAWYGQQLARRGWNAQAPDVGSTTYAVTRGTGSLDLFEIDVNLNIDGSPYRDGNNGTQYTTDFQHTFKSGRC